MTKGTLKYNRMFLCEDCIIVFQIHTKIHWKKKPHCPSCGEFFEVVEYNADLTTKREEGKKIPKTRWKPKEIELLQKAKKGELQPHQIAVQTGRSINSIKKKLSRI